MNERASESVSPRRGAGTRAAFGALALCVAATCIGTRRAAQDEAGGPAHWTLIERAVEEGGASDELAVVLDHMGTLDVPHARVSNRLASIRSGLAHPWEAPARADALRALLAGPASASARERTGVPALFDGIAELLELEGYEAPSDECAHPGLADLHASWGEVERAEGDVALLEALSAYVELAHVLLDEALARLDDDERARLFDPAGAFHEAWYRDHFPDQEQTPEARAAIDGFKALMLPIDQDRALLLGVASALGRIVDPSFVDTLPKRLARVATEGAEAYGEDVVAAVGDAPTNTVLVTGRKASASHAPAALVIDLGGDDHYARAAVVDSGAALVSIVIDLAGDDEYASERRGPAFALGGIALLVDRRGDDRYKCGRMGEGAAIFGVAASFDLEGDDAYAAEDFAQGHATVGVGLLYDLEGNDTYDAWAYAQGGGLGIGLAALVDGDGDDRYLADGVWPDVYGNSGPDVHQGASQGYSTGLRPEAAGGIAALVDLGDGRDRYQAGSFSQGGGYFFSFGLMYDGGGDDENYGARYAQGFGVHQGIGVRHDAGGDDTYTCKSVAHCGMSWDEGVGYLLEDAGDDVYRTGDLSCGGAAQTGIAIALDLDGKDEYRTGRQSAGGSGASEYHEKPALGVLVDLGGDKDTYDLEGRADNTFVSAKGIEVFLDSKAKDIERVLRGRELK